MRKLNPSPGRLIVKMRPISRFHESSLTSPNGGGIRIEKPPSSIEMEEMTNSHATVVSVGPPRTVNESTLQPWFEVGDDVIISRVGGTKLELTREEDVVVYWLIPYECVQAVYARDEVDH